VALLFKQKLVNPKKGKKRSVEKPVNPISGKKTHTHRVFKKQEAESGWGDKHSGLKGGVGGKVCSWGWAVIYTGANIPTGGRRRKLDLCAKRGA